MGFVARIISAQARVYCLQKDVGTPQECYYFLQVDSRREHAFLKALEGKLEGNISDFGRVAASGWGTPSEELKATMQEKYNMAFAA